MKLINANQPMSPQDFHTILSSSLKSALLGAATVGEEGFDAALEAITSSLIFNMGTTIAASCAGDMAVIDEAIFQVEDLVRKTAMDVAKDLNERIRKATEA